MKLHTFTLFSAFIFAVALLFTGVYSAYADNGEKNFPAAANSANVRSGAEANKRVKAASEDYFLASIDLTLLYRSHPLMAYYDPAVSLFIKSSKDDKQYDSFSNLIAARKNQFKDAYDRNKSEITNLASDIKYLESEIDRINKLIDFKSQQIVSKYEQFIKNAPDSLSLKEVLFQKNKELKAVENYHCRELKERTDKLAATLDSFEKIRLSLIKIYYLTPAETAKMFEKINNDVALAVCSAAEKKGVEAVLNSALFDRPALEPENFSGIADDDKKSERINRLDRIMEEGPDCSKIFASLRSFDENELKNEDATVNNPAHIEKLRLLHKQGLYDFAADLYRSSSGIKKIEPIRGFITQPIVYGGVDISGQAVEELLKINGGIK